MRKDPVTQICVTLRMLRCGPLRPSFHGQAMLVKSNRLCGMKVSLSWVQFQMCTSVRLERSIVFHFDVILIDILLRQLACVLSALKISTMRSYLWAVNDEKTAMLQRVLCLVVHGNNGCCATNLNMDIPVLSQVIAVQCGCTHDRQDPNISPCSISYRGPRPDMAPRHSRRCKIRSAVS